MSQWRARIVAFVIIAIASSAVAQRARAEPTPDEKLLATALFREARALIAEGHVKEACVKFAESQRLDPGGGTLLNLASCHEREGKTASAWAEYAQALAVARRDHRADREAVATERVAALEPQLIRIVIRVPSESDLPGLEVRRDGSIVGRAAWGSAIPADPGSHAIEATASGRAPWRAEVTATIAGETKEIVVPPLAAEIASEPAAPPASIAPPAIVAPSPAPRAEGEARPPKRGSIARTAGFVVGGAGIAAVGVGAYFGLRAFAKRSDSDAHCLGSRCTPEGASLNDQARVAADVSTVAFSIGAAAIGIGAVLVLTAPSARAQAITVRLVPLPGGAALGARF